MQHRHLFGLVGLSSYLPASIALFLLGSHPYERAANPPVVWAASSLRRVGPNDPAERETSIQLWAARGEYESFQIVTQSPTDGQTDLEIAVSDLTGPRGEVISKDNLTLYREYYVFIGENNGSPDWHGSNRPLGPGWYPDVLAPLVRPLSRTPHSSVARANVPYKLPAGKNQPIWVDVFVPGAAVPGRYSGTYVVRNRQASFTGHIAVNVWNFSLPLQPALISSFGVWNPNKSEIYRELLRNRIMPDRAPVSEQGSLIHQYGLNATGLGFWSGASYGNCKMSPPPRTSAVQSVAAAQDHTLFLYDFSADEIDKCAGLFPLVKQWARSLHAADVRNLIPMSPTPQLFNDGSGTGRSAVDIWAVLPGAYTRNSANVQSALRKGDQVWSYNAEVQDSYSPKWQIDFAPINFRIQPGFINQSLNLTGLLYWRVDRWSPTPWTNVFLNESGASFPGDGELVYPGSPIGISEVIPSMRLKWLRDGVDDYDYIQLLKQAGYGDSAIKIAKSVGPDWIHWTRDPKVLEAARLKLGEMLNNLGETRTSCLTPRSNIACETQTRNEAAPN